MNLNNLGRVQQSLRRVRFKCFLVAPIKTLQLQLKPDELDCRRELAFIGLKRNFRLFEQTQVSYFSSLLSAATLERQTQTQVGQKSQKWPNGRKSLSAGEVYLNGHRDGHSRIRPSLSSRGSHVDVMAETKVEINSPDFSGSNRIPYS